MEAATAATSRPRARAVGRVYAVVSVNAFNDVQPSLLRRKRNWIPDVRFVERGA
jgi:hypothetical protein